MIRRPSTGVLIRYNLSFRWSKIIKGTHAMSAVFQVGNTKSDQEIEYVLFIAFVVASSCMKRAKFSTSVSQKLPGRDAYALFPTPASFL